MNTRNRVGLTALDLALQRGDNASMEELAEVATLLVEAGARPSAKTASFVRQLGETFEFHRKAFSKKHLAAAEAGLRQLYKLFNVAPVPTRATHDGKSRITVKATTLAAQHKELWELLVPSSGAAETVQGELTRIAGRVYSEFHRNGGANWDAQYKKMCDAFLKHVGDAALVPIIKRVKSGRPTDDDLALLVVASVRWVLANPKPVSLGPVAYSR